MNESSILTIALFLSGLVLSGIISYFTAQTATISRLVKLETSLEQSIRELTGTIAHAHRDMVAEVESVRQELRTYYQRRGNDGV